MWYLIVAVVYWLVMVFATLYFFLTCSITERYTRDSRGRRKHYINFSDPKSYIWLTIDILWYIPDALTWPIVICVKMFKISKLFIEYKASRK